MDDTESSFLGRLNANYDRLVKEKKNAKIAIVLASIGIAAGLSASFVFFIVYNYIITASFALLAGIIKLS